MIIRGHPAGSFCLENSLRQLLSRAFAVRLFRLRSRLPHPPTGQSGLPLLTGWLLDRLRAGPVCASRLLCPPSVRAASLGRWPETISGSPKQLRPGQRYLPGVR